MAKNWASQPWSTCPGGVSSAVTPEILPNGQFAWGYNIAVRGGKPHTRPPMVELDCGLPPGLHQGSSYFGVQGGMIVTAIGGRLYRVRIGENIYSWEPIPLGFRNSGTIKQVWMQQTVETLVIQDGQSNAILYNGSTARRAGVTEVPRGRQMAYGNGRLWVAINRNELVAGDIRQRAPGSELFFTETNYLVGGGALFFPRGITGLEFIPVTGAADFGTLIVGGADYCDSIRADVTTRDQWGMPGFITTVFRDIGFSGDWAIAQVNQDLYFRDSNGNIRSLANAISTNNSPGSTPISREVSRIVGYDSEQLLPWVSTIYFNNRLLTTASPYLNISGGVSFKDIVSLDFSPISTMQVKAPPAYDGTWQGIPGVTQLITGQFDGRNRAFCISSDQEGINRIWEILSEGDGRDDISVSCGSGLITETPIESFIEYPSVNFGDEKRRKKLERCDVWVSGLDGGLELSVFWRPDNTQQWTQWDEVETCAKTTDAATNTPHTWKNLLPEQRPQIKSFTIPDGIDAVVKYALQNGFFHQIRLVWSGKCKIEKVMLNAVYLDDPDYANRETLVAECIENNITGNEINYVIPTSAGFLYVTPPDSFNPTGPFGGPFTPASVVYNIRNLSDQAFDWIVTPTVPWMMVDIDGGTLLPGEDLDITVTLDADALDADTYRGALNFQNITNMCGDAAFDVVLTVTSDFPGETMSFVQWDGPFVYPPCMTEWGNRYYKTETADGENIVKYAPKAGDVNLRTCSLSGVPPAYGLVSTEWSGTSTLDMACVRTGQISTDLRRTGALGAYDFPGVPGTLVTISDDSVDEIFADLFGPSGFAYRPAFASENYEEYASHTADEVFRVWSSPDAPQGYFAGQFGGPYDYIYCQGPVLTVTLSDPVTIEDLATPIARVGPYGSPAWRQTMHAFNGTTRTNLGNMSRAIFTVPVDATRDTLTGIFTFLIEPDVGSDYNLIIIQDYDITSATVSGFVNYPMIEDAEVTLTSWIWTYQKNLSEEFETYTVGGSILTLAPSGGWPTVARFDAPHPNTDCWDDFENYPETGPTQIRTLPYGVRWAGQGTTYGVDQSGAYDDFESYPVGTDYLTLAQGVGWVDSAALTVADYEQSWDDFESYAVGTITVLDFAGFNNKWFGDGSFLQVNNLNAWDDLESYAAGSITIFNFTSTDNLWDGDGRAVP